MSLYGVNIGDKAALRKLYNDKESSDVILILGYGKPIYAHEQVFSAGCEDFRGGRHDWMSTNSEERLNLSNVINFGVCRGVDQDSFESAIKHMYGFKFKGVGKPPHLLLELAEVAHIAQLLQITGLFELVSEIASRAMIECVDNEAKMRTFLSVGRHISQDVIRGKPRIFHPLAVEILGSNFFEIYNMKVVRDTFNSVPSLARDLL